MALTLDGFANSSKSSATSATVSLTTTKTNDIIVVVVGAEATTGVPPIVSGVSSTSGLTWAKRSTKSATANAQEVWWALAPSILTNEVITVTYTATFDDWAGTAFGVNGCNTAAPWDTSTSLPAFGVYPDGTAAAAPAVSGVSTVSTAPFVFMAFAHAYSSTLTAPAGFTMLGAGVANGGGTYFEYAAVAYEVFGAALTSQTITWGASNTFTRGATATVDALVAVAVPTLTLGLTGNKATGRLGTLAANATGSVSVALTGNKAMGRLGSVTAPATVASGFVLLESWQTYNTSADITRRWVYQQGNGGTLASGGLLVNGSQVSYCNTHIPPLQKLRMGFNFTAQAYAPTVSNSSFLHLLQGGETNNNNQIGLGLNPDGTLSVFYGPNFSGLGGTTLANGTTVLALNTAYWIELDVQIATGTAGSVTLKLNGVTEIALSGISTCYQTYGWVERVALTAGANALHLFGGLYIGDGSRGWIGPSNVSRVLLNADTAQKDFVSSTGGASAPLLNTINASTFVASSSLSATDLYTVAPLSPTPSAITAVQVEAEALQVDSTNRINVLQPVIRQSGIARGRGAVNVPAALPATWYTEPRGIYDFTPTATPWTAAALAATQVGFRIAPWSKGFNFRATAAYVTDKPANTYVLNELYPTTRGGATFGWDSQGTGNVAFDRSTAEDIYAGVNCQSNSGVQRTFRVDVPAPGRYQVRMLVGDTNAHAQVYAQVRDGTTPLFTLDSTLLSAVDFQVAGGLGMDAGGVCNYGIVSWDEYNVGREVALTGTALYVTIGSPTAGTDFTCLAHLEVVALDYTAALTTQAPQVKVQSLYVEALVSQAAGPVTLSGNAATGRLGTPAVTHGVAPLGVKATSKVGTLTATSAASLTLALTGNKATSKIGAVSQPGLIALTGTQATGHAGAVTASTATSRALIGNVLTGRTGTLAATQSRAVALAGNSAVGHAGTVTAINGIIIALSGNKATGRLGQVAQPRTSALMGVHATAHVGSVTAVTASGNTLVGNQSLGHVGQALVNRAVAPTGTQATGHVGTPHANVTLALTGNAATARVGLVASRASVGLTGSPASGRVGRIATTSAVPMLRVAATTKLGSMVLSAASVAGVRATGRAGALTGSATLVLAGVRASGRTGRIRVGLYGGATVLCVNDTLSLQVNNREKSAFVTIGNERILAILHNNKLI